MSGVAASEILRGAWALLDGSDISTVESEDFKLFRGALHRNLRVAWEDMNWPSLVKVEKRQFRAGWAVGTGYTSGNQVYHFDSGKYAQALQASTGEAPFDVSEVENSAYWAELKEAYTGDDYAAGTTYAVGDIVYYPANDGYYQCISASTGNLPTNTTFWGGLTEFDRTIAYVATGETSIGYVEGVFEKHPRRIRNASRYDYTLGDDEIVVLDDVSTVWLEFVEATPDLTGDEYSGTTTYAVGNQIYYSVSTGGSGDFYNCITATSAGESPTTDAAKWSVVELPRMFELYLIHSVARELSYASGRSDLPISIQQDPIYHLENQKLNLQRQGLIRNQRRRT